MADDETHSGSDAAKEANGENDQGAVMKKESPVEGGTQTGATGRVGESEAPAADEGSAKPSQRKSAHGKADSDRKPTKKEVKELLEQKEEEIARLILQSESLRTEVTDLKDKWLRSVAEFENYRKRTRKEWELLQQRTKAEIILDIVGVVDDFERAFSVVGDRDDDFIRGIQLIYNNLMSALERIGVQKIEALNSAFDPSYHMAVAQIDRDGAEANQVVEVVQQGYCLGDIVVRPAKVVIAK